MDRGRGRKERKKDMSEKVGGKWVREKGWREVMRYCT